MLLGFREQSEELRASNIRRHQEEVCTERAAQIQMRQEEHRLQQEEEMLFAQLWEGDRLAKEQRENLRAQRRRENNLEQLSFLRTQMEAAEQQRLQAKQLKEEEAQLLVHCYWKTVNFGVVTVPPCHIRPHNTTISLIVFL